MFERRGDTGSQPLVVADGEVRITGETDFAAGGGETVVDARGSIEDAIHEALNTPMPPPAVLPGVTARPARSARPAQPAQPAQDDAPGGRKGFDLSDGGEPPDGPELPTLPKLPRVPDDLADEAEPRAATPAPVPSVATPRGGVGLGLPYTGPHGVPVFGLTPEQRLAGSSAALAAARDGGVASALEPDPRRSTAVPQLRKRLGLYVVIATCAVAIGVAGAVITANLSHGNAVVLDPATPAGAAAAALAQGDPARALQILDASKAAIEGDANAQLVLGHVRASRNENGLALTAYDRALALDPELEADDKLRAALRTMAGSKQDYEVVARAFDLWVGRTDDGEARKLLLVSAVHDDLARRKAVRPVIEHHHLGDSVDWLRVYSLDLQQEPTCELRREAVAKLRALGDARAVTALEHALVATSKSPSYRGTPDQRVPGRRRERGDRLPAGAVAEVIGPLELPDVPRWIEAHGIAADPDGWRRELGGGFAVGSDRARLIVVAGGADPAAVADLAGALPRHTLLIASERADLAAATGRRVARAVLHTLPEGAGALGAEAADAAGAVALPPDASLAHLPAALAEELEAVRPHRTIWTVFLDGAPVSFAYAPWRSPRWFDVSVDTLPEARQLGLGRLVAAAMIRDEQAHGRAPVWGADEDNAASLRLARALGLVPVDELWVAA